MSDDSAAWVFLELDEKNARRSGMPMQVPLRKRDMETVADGGLTAELAKTSIAAFQKEAPSSWRTQNAALATRFDAYIGKQMYMDRVEAAIKKGDVDATIAALSMVARLDREDHGAKMNLAVAYAKKGNQEAALKELAAVESTFEEDPDYHCMRGQALLATEKTEEALEQFVLALEANPDCKPALDALVRMGALVAVYEDPRDATSLVYLRSDSMAEHLATIFAERTAEELLEHLAYHESEARHAVVLAAADAMAAKPDATPRQRERAATAKIAALRGLGRSDDALAAAKALVAENDASAAAHVELARSMSDREAARAELDRALELDPGDMLALDLRFWPEDKDALVDVHAAIPALAAFAAAHPNSTGAQRSLARAKLTIDAVDDALALFAQAVALEPESDDLRAEYWTELTRAGRHEEVIADAAKLGDMARRSWALRWGEAEAYGRLGKKMEAHTAFAALTNDMSLPVTVRKRARRAAQRVQEG